MGARISPGFTIIETVLFLAVTGLLIMGVIIGTSSALNTQRYRDAVESFKDTLQTQYSELGSVKNSRLNNWSCNAAALPIEGGSENRGQSECMLVGRYLRIVSGDLTAYSVLARRTGNAENNDIAKLETNFVYNIDPGSIDEQSLGWGTEIAWPVTGSNARPPGTQRSIGILFIRSPDSGNIYTFSSNTVPDESSINQATFADLIAPGNAIPGQGSRTLCIRSSGLTSSGDMAIHMAAFAASASAVETRSNEYLQNVLGSSTRC